MPSLGPEAIRDLPEHVAPHQVRPFGLHMAYWDGRDPFADAARVHQGPDVFYAPGVHQTGQGAWVLTRAADMRRVLLDTEVFSSRNQIAMAQMIGETWKVIPIELDPPEHSAVRTLLAPLFSPKKLAELESFIRGVLDVTLEKVLANESCEFIHDFAQAFPVSVFLNLVDLPLDRAPEFLGWAHQMLHTGVPEIRAEGVRNVRDYITDVLEERKRRPAEDFLSYAIKSTIDGRPVTDDEIIGIAFQLLIAGLDTVTASTGFIFRHLALHIEDQERLRREPALIPTAVEEMLRAYSVAFVSRKATVDTEIAGVKIKSGDRVLCALPYGNRDPREFDRPNEVVLDRSPNPHLAFSYGAHRCIGLALARLEIRLAVEAWLSRAPPFRLPAGGEIRMHVASVSGVDSLPLTWATAA